MYANHEYSRFHESYYVHPCSIVPEKDVVFTDIVGNGFLVQVKRWWHDLFLLSFSSVRSRGFYNSSHAMRIERFRQYRKYRSRIHPMSKFSYFWNCVIVFAVLLTKILFRFTSSILFEAWTPGQGLMIVDVGVLAVYTVNYEETGHLIDGDYFGEISLVTDKEVRMSYVVAVTSCRILILDKLIFRNYMRKYPEIFYDLKRKLYIRNERLMKLKRLGTLLESRINEQAEETGTSKAPEAGAGESSV
ncbi:unnamed protein product [Arctia plantaginis]|uniref:Cyclic nucleotide-binding domain-containing protein n=1 Tax=Arctia plantaginis TaxID=874455 RepID=A0A8S0Z0J4_ARCPL|nr:unnamed protein product [Arctia plantaginis]